MHWTVRFFSFFILHFLFLFYTRTYIHTPLDTHCTCCERSRGTPVVTLTENRPNNSTLPLTRTIFFFSELLHLDTRRNYNSKTHKKKETESGAPLALNAIECSLSLCHVDRFKWLSDKSSRRLVQMYLWRRTRRRKEKRRKKIRTI